MDEDDRPATEQEMRPGPKDLAHGFHCTAVPKLLELPRQRPKETAAASGTLRDSHAMLDATGVMFSKMPHFH